MHGHRLLLLPPLCGHDEQSFSLMDASSFRLSEPRRFLGLFGFASEDGDMRT